MHIAVLIISIFVLAILSSTLSMSEIAFFSLPVNKVNSYRHQTDPRKRLIVKLLENSKNLLVTIFILNTITNVLVQNLTSDLFPSEGNFGLKVVIPLFLLFIFGELLPKYYGFLYNEAITVRVAVFYDVIQKVISPIRLAVTSCADFFSRLFFFFLKADRALSYEEIEHALATSQAEGLLHEDEVGFIQGYLHLEERKVKDIMIPRRDVSVYSTTQPLSQLMQLLATHGVAVLCEEKHEVDQQSKTESMSSDSVYGLITARDYFVCRQNIRTVSDIKSIIKTPLFIPESASARSVLQELLQQCKQLAVVVDEYGVFSGVVSRRDLLRVMGMDMNSRFDSDYIQVAEDTFVIRARMPLQALSDLLHVPLESPHHVASVGGYITEMLDHIPKTGETFEKANMLFRVLESDVTHVTKLFVQKKKLGIR